MAYADFAYYTEEYKGIRISGAGDFDEAANEASNLMDAKTCFKIKSSGQADSEQVKKCCCALSDFMHKLKIAEKDSQIDSAGRALQTEKVDEHWLTYDTSRALTGASAQAYMHGIINDYLSCLGLLRGSTVRTGRVIR